MDTIAVTLAVEDEALERFDEILDQVEALGFEFRMTVPSLGVISGSIPVARLRDLRRLRGINIAGSEVGFLETGELDRAGAR